MNDEISIRPAEPADLQAILAINAAGQPGVSALTPAELRIALGQSPYLYVAELSGAIVGYLIAYTGDQGYDGEEFAWFRQHFARFLYIDQVAIAASARRAGVGMRLYADAEVFAREQLLDSIVCEVNIETPNPTSRAFHERNGFSEVGILSTGDGRTVSLRRKLVYA
jgi:predicted GNAT superfamily acetyltransferase